AGAAAGVAAIFKAPATGLVFALEVPYQEDFARRMLLPAAISAAVGYLTFVAFRGTAPILAVRGAAPFDLRDIAGAAVLGVLCGISRCWLPRATRRCHVRCGIDGPPWLHRARSDCHRCCAALHGKCLGVRVPGGDATHVAIRWSCGT